MPPSLQALSRVSCESNGVLWPSGSEPEGEVPLWFPGQVRMPSESLPVSWNFYAPTVTCQGSDCRPEVILGGQQNFSEFYLSNPAVQSYFFFLSEKQNQNSNSALNLSKQW